MVFVRGKAFGQARRGTPVQSAERTQPPTSLN